MISAIELTTILKNTGAYVVYWQQIQTITADKS
jgi:hypothetical protein